MDARPALGETMEAQLEPIVRLLAEACWPPVSPAGVSAAGHVHDGAGLGCHCFVG